VYGSVGRHLGHEVDARGPGFGSGCGAEVGLVRVAERSGHRAGVADEPGEAAGVDPGDPGDAAAHEQVGQVTLRPVVAGAAGEIADDHAATERTARLVVVGVDAVVADVGVVNVMIWPA
jgi:hypothetical protein